MLNKKIAEEKKDNILAVINNITDGLIVFDRDGKVSLINPAAQKIFGVKEEDLLGKLIVNFLDFGNIKNLFYLLGKEVKEVAKKELEISKDLILEVTSLPILKGGKKLGNLIIFHDITREKAIENMKTEFVSISAHQLRTPLSEIRWTLDALFKEKVGKLTEAQKDILKKAYESNERMLSLVDDLLNIVKIEEGRQIYRLVPSHFEEIVKLVIKFHEESIRKNQIKIEFRHPNKQLPKIKIDAQKIFLVIQNLLENAIEYNLPKGTIAINLNYTDKEIEFSISDTGIGIPKNQQQNIFKKFFRSENAVKKETEGNGLGLFIAKNIIEAHNGKIWFKSEEGSGSVFHFTLPY